MFYNSYKNNLKENYVKTLIINHPNQLELQINIATPICKVK